MLQAAGGLLQKHNLLCVIGCCVTLHFADTFILPLEYVPIAFVIWYHHEAAI